MIKWMKVFQPVLQKIRSQQPEVVYLSGKTCTGKTTLARYLSKSLNFGHIELDNIVHGIESDTLGGGQKFVEAYRHRNDMTLVRKVVAVTRQQIDRELIDHTAVVFEGALANNETLSEIVSDYNFLFVYLLPVKLDAYVSRITERFMQVSPDSNAGLPPAFWKHINSAALEGFYVTRIFSLDLKRGVSEYANESMKEAKARLNMFAQKFNNILVVEI